MTTAYNIENLPLEKLKAKKGWPRKYGRWNDDVQNDSALKTLGERPSTKRKWPKTFQPWLLFIFFHESAPLTEVLFVKHSMFLSSYFGGAQVDTYIRLSFFLDSARPHGFYQVTWLSCSSNWVPSEPSQGNYWTSKFCLPWIASHVACRNNFHSYLCGYIFER